MSKMQSIELNDQFKRALLLMEEAGGNVFVTGKAGTGKSTLLEYFRSKTKKKIAVLAPTGVAALNVRGQTIHSFFRFKPDITVDKVKKFNIREEKNIYKKIETLVIDEISMVRADLFDCIDRFMRLNGRSKIQPFGGVQLFLFGDLYQLPPVVTGKEREIFRSHYKSQYFFDAKAFADLPIEFVELEKIYRQSDDHFITLLNSIRNNSAGEVHLAAINERLNPGFTPDSQKLVISLTTTNKLADEINTQQLAKIKGRVYRYTGSVSGDFETSVLPTDKELEVKKGAQVMLVNNDSQGRWVNGSIGRIIDIAQGKEEEDAIVVELADEDVVEVLPYTWEMFRFSYDERAGKLISETVGSFTQYPMILAWAVTIHKSQGKTFDRVIIDIGSGTFAHGQLYVALSRCTSLTGITLKRPIAKKHIFTDWRIVRFLTHFQYQLADGELPLEEKISRIQSAIDGGKKLEIIYLKSNDEKSTRIITPSFVGETEYAGRTFTGVTGFDSKRREERMFNVARILKMREID